MLMTGRCLFRRILLFSYLYLYVFICIMSIPEFERILYGVCKQLLYRPNHENRQSTRTKHIHAMQVLLNLK